MPRFQDSFSTVQQEEEQVNLLKYSQSGLIKKSRHWVPLTVSRAATSTSTGKDLECIMSAVDLAAPSLHSHQSNLEATLLGSPAQRQCEKGNISGIFRHCQVERASSAGIFVFYANLWPRRVSSSLSDFFFSSFSYFRGKASQWSRLSTDISPIVLAYDL